MHAPQFTHTYEQMGHLIRGMRLFTHIHSNLSEAVATASDQMRWDVDRKTAYQAVLPSLLTHEYSIKNNENTITRDTQLIKPQAMLRRLAFLYGVTCVCGKVHGGYSALPLSRDNVGYRAPFACDYPRTLEPLCPECKKDFREYCDKICGPSPGEESVNLASIGWLSKIIKKEGLKFVRDYKTL